MPLSEHVISSPRYEDFEITYHHKNPWAMLGLGYVPENRVPGSDVSPYLKLENIDPKWLEAVGGSEWRSTNLSKKELEDLIGDTIQG